MFLILDGNKLKKIMGEKWRQGRWKRRRGGGPGIRGRPKKRGRNGAADVKRAQ